MAHLPEDELPSQFDVVIDGTGLVQSIVAAALARNDKSVLHIDRNCYYGEQWAGLMHRELIQWLEGHRSDSTESSNDPAPGDNCISLRASLPSSISNICEIVHEHVCPETQQQDNASPETQQQDNTGPEMQRQDNASPETAMSSEEAASEQSAPSEVSAPSEICQHTTWQSLESLRRRFTYDIIPKVLYCRGALVDLLTQSNCSRYIEFKAINRVFTQRNEHIEQVPCSRADVFSSQSVSMLEKRKMMKFLSFCSEFDKHPEQYEEFVSVPFADYLKGRDLSENLCRYIIHSIAMVDETTPTVQGLNATKVFLNSLGRFGNAPFIYPIFGVGELPQAFCRMCAVFGGVYCLNRHVSALNISTETNAISSVVCSTGQTIQCSSVVCSAGVVHHSHDLGAGLSSESVSRAILVTDGPIHSTQGIVTVVTIPPFALGSHQTKAVRILQLDPSTNTAVPGTFLIHMECSSNGGGETAFKDLEPVTRALFNTQGENDECSRTSSRVLYSLYFNVELHHIKDTGLVGLPSNLYLTSDPDTTMTYEGAVKEARMIFEKICPGDEFLPRPPDPEDIVYEDAPANDQVNEQEQAATNEENPGNNQSEPQTDNENSLN